MLQRLLVEKIENRILLGVTMFLGIMVLVGWVAINEPGRMQAFEEQYLGRSVERGAALFANNCTTCHGPDGRGLTGVAPALNNPVLFGYDYLADIRSESERLQTAQTEFDALTTEFAAQDVTEERKTEIQTRLDAITAEYGENPTDAITAQLAELETQRTAFTAQIQSAIEKGFDPETLYDRLAYLGWGGTLEAFIHTTLISGRPVSESYWPNPMAAWSQTAGGPLRDDQIQDITNYILNFDREWTLEDLLAVNQFAVRPGQANTATIENPIGTDVAAILTQLETVTGDANNGQTLYNGALGCSGCHSTTVAPPTDETWLTVTQGDRLSDPALAGYTPEQYLVQSIVAPQAYTVPGFAQAMPQNFGERLDIQMLADILAYLESYDQP